MEKQHYTEEQKQVATNVSIADYVRANGYKCEQRGKEIRVHGYGGLNVNPSNNSYYIFSRGKGGVGCVSFLMEVENMSFLQAMKTLVGDGETVRSYEQHIGKKEVLPEKEVKEFIKPEKSADYKRLFAYLMNERKLSAATVNAFVKAGILYQGKLEYKKDGETRHSDNAVFLAKDDEGNDKGAIIEGLNSNYRFKGNMGDFSDLNYVKGVPDKVYIFEAPIDLMSFVQLHPEIDNARFVAMGGLNPSIAQKYINSGLQVISCVDNDAAGKKFNDRLLIGKMGEVWNGEYEHNSLPDREPPIEYLTVKNNGKEVNLFLSKQDCADYNKICGKEKSAFVFHNRTNFQINSECRERNVKDFNDLIKQNAPCTSKSTVNTNRSVSAKDTYSR